MLGSEHRLTATVALADAVSMTRSLKALAVLVVFASLLASAPRVEADDSPVGTWIKKAEGGKPEMTMTVEAWGAGKGKLTYRVKGMMGIAVTIVSALDGSEAPVLVNGKASSETQAIKLVDKYHLVTVVKMDGKPYGMSKGTFSKDFRTLTVENDFSAATGGSAAAKSTEVWVRK